MKEINEQKAKQLMQDYNNGGQKIDVQASILFGLCESNIDKFFVRYFVENERNKSDYDEPQYKKSGKLVNDYLINVFPDLFLKMYVDKSKDTNIKCYDINCLQNG